MVAAKACGFFFFKRTNTAVYVRERTAAGVRDVEYEVCVCVCVCVCVGGGMCVILCMLEGWGWELVSTCCFHPYPVVAY